ncbi:NADPH-dependent ferric siderophore reductase, contains FAD-binding and SIP domains [Rhizobium sp. RU35A]|uniref:siderophore-interacting protein n=1 Tax=Rhizobium sp. RU35A TaxID=1907414 RepID=UPI000954BFC3|nr:siderophore-interacting protein [Rhizobium sp. RU35A]SIR09303.1 NADPH-dependent ferric siderophore reductase, contains FAD-binding and SIP domains [Rhizobium sp. RU35A]
MDQPLAPNAEMPRQRPQLPSWTLTVADAFDITPQMRRVLFSIDRFADFTYKPGQDIVFFLPLENGETGRRHYTIRNIDRDAGTIAVDFVMHGNTPGPNFARQAKAGDTVEVKGPRGRVVFNPEADWHLLTGDETCIPGILHILETLPPGARAFAFIEVQDAGWHQRVETRANVAIEWIHRGDVPAGPSSVMLDRLAAFALPEGRGQALIIGETSNVRAQRHHLIGRGLGREQIASEGYWRPGRHGGHDHVDD